jgi:acyl-CoA oxidase
LAAAKSGLTIAIKYSDQRRQFGPEGGLEVPLNYRIHQRRLLPLLAKTYAIHFALQYVTNRFITKKESEMQEIEALAAGMKAILLEHNGCFTGMSRSYWRQRLFIGKSYRCFKNDTEIYTTLRVIIQY